MKSQDGLVHDPGQEEDLVDLGLFGYPAELVLEGTSDLGFEETLLLLGCGCHHLQCIKNPFGMSSRETLIVRRVYKTSCRSGTGRGAGETPASQ